jgi:hypothetical protein
MATKYDLEQWVEDALRSLGGSAMLADVAREIWNRHEAELRASGDLFYTWQYDMRWAAQRLRDAGRSRLGPERGSWELTT